MKLGGNLLTSQRTPIFARFLIITCWLMAAIYYSINKAIDLPINHLDGAFQTASGLFRLDNGQWPGREFFPYLGIGPLYLLFPIYKVFGSNLAASIISSHLTVAMLLMLSGAFIFHTLWRPKSAFASIAGGCLLTYLISILPYVFDHYFLTWGLTPGNSLRPVRAFIPYLSAALFSKFIHKNSNTICKYSYAGLTTSVILLWSNDFAYTTALLFFALITIYSLAKNEFNLKNQGLFAATTILTTSVIYYLIYPDHPFEMLKYNLADVAKDQWWYFAPYGEQARVLQLKQLLHLAGFINPLGMGVFALLFLHLIKYKYVETALLIYVGFALYAGGVTASVGGHIDSGYFAAYRYWLMMTTFCGILHLMWQLLSAKYTKPLVESHAVISLNIALALQFIPISFSIYKLKTESEIAKQDSNRIYVTELGGYLPKEWLDYVNLARRTPVEDTVLEEYWGVWSALRHSFFDWPVDSIIHALGDTREKARLNMRAADIVTTTRRTSTPLASEWQPWNLSMNYWFYDELIGNYSIQSYSPTTVVWKHNDNLQVVALDTPCEKASPMKNSAMKFHLDPPGYYEISMRYKYQGSRRALIMVQNNINYASDSNGYISLDPGSTHIKFPAYFYESGYSNLNVKIVGDDDASIDIVSCEARKINLSDDEILPSLTIRSISK